MKILFIHDFYQQFGGEDSVALAERQLLEERGEEVLFWTRHNDEIKDYGILQKANFFAETVYSRRTVRDLRKAAAEFKPDVAFVHNIYPLISPSLYYALHALRVPIVQVLHDFRPFCSNGWFYIDGKICERCKFGNHLHGVTNRCFRDSYVLSALYATTLGVNRRAGMLDRVDAFICLTGFFKEKILEIGIPEEKIFIRPNFIDTAPLRTGSDETENGNYALFLGRLSNEKGLWTLIHAFEPLPEIELRIVGTGPLEQEIRNYLQEKNLRHIKLLGFKSGDEKWQLIKNCHCGIIPSQWYENFPIAALEFYAASKPIVASKMGGLPYVIHDQKSGLLFEAGQTTELTQKVQRLFSNPAEARCMGRQGRLLAETTYGPQQSYDNLMGIFETVLARFGSPQLVPLAR